MSKDSNAKIFSVIGGCRRSGQWLVPEKTDMMTFFGRAVIDLRQAQTTADELEFTCTSAFANVTFIVPEGAEVRPSGIAVLGSSKCIVPVTGTPCHLPPISVDATTILGRIRVRTTDSDPDHDDQGRRWFQRRKKKRRAEAEVMAADTADGGPRSVVDASPLDGVEPRGFSDGLPSVAGATETSAQTAEAVPAHALVSPPSATSPIPPAPDGPSTTFIPPTPEPAAEPPPDGPANRAGTPDEALESAVDDATEATASRDGASEDDQSPLEGVEVPPSLEGTIAAT